MALTHTDRAELHRLGAVLATLADLAGHPATPASRHDCGEPYGHLSSCAIFA